LFTLIEKRMPVLVEAEYWESPSRLAFRFLGDLDLGPELDDDSQFVDVPDELSISLLQKR
jgi:hypothetical protein